MHVMETYIPGVNVIHSGDTTLQMTYDAIFNLTDREVLEVHRWFLCHHNDLVNIGLFIEFGEGEFYGEYTRNLAELCLDETVKKLARDAIDNAPRAEWEKQSLKRIGRIATQKAVRDGRLTKAQKCAVCRIDPQEIKTEVWHTAIRHKQLVAHHWRGYNYPLCVWWVCYSCNRKLTGKHDGSLCSPAEAREYLQEMTP